MNDLTLPQKIVCGYYDCSKFGNLKISPERISECYEIEYYLEDGKYVYINGSELKIIADHILIARPGNRRRSRLPFKTAFLKFEAVGNSRSCLTDSRFTLRFSIKSKFLNYSMR